MFTFHTISKNLGAVLLAAALGLTACDKKKDDGKGTGGGVTKPSASGKKTIVIDGSDTMVNLAQKWAEEYQKTHTDVEIQVSGGGSGVGVAGLIGGKLDMANSSRKLDEKEITKAKENNNGKEPKEFIVGLDALAVYVHPSNSLETISIEELAEIYGDGGMITKWSQIGGKVSANTDEIVRISRQNSSGTYAYFREAVLGKKRDFKQGSVDQSGSKDVVALVGKTAGSIGYSGMGYADPVAKWLKVSKKKGDPAFAPSVETAKNGTYPIARPLLIYTLGEPTGHVKDYITWIMSADGQKIVKDLGYIPL